MWYSAKYIGLLGIMLLSSTLAAQSPMEVEMADAMRANGKIYVVVVIAALVFTAILAYLIYIDRKLKKLEKDLKE